MMEIREYFNRVMHMTTRAYQMCPDQKSVLKLRQAQDKLLDNIIEMTKPETIISLQNLAMRDYFKKKAIEE